MRYGLEGYGLYFYCLEIITSNVHQNNITFELSHDAEIISHNTGIHFKKVQDMMTFMIDLDLFEISEGVITCMQLFKRLDQSMTSSKALRQLLHQNKLEDSNNHDPIMTPSEKHMQDYTRLDKTRLNKTKEHKSKTFKPPSLIQIQHYCQERKNNIDPIKFLNHYQANGWFRGKTKIKCWKACVRTWETNDTNDSRLDAAL